MSSESIEFQVDESFKTTGDTTELYAKIAVAQGDFESVAKTAQGQIGRDRVFKYADYMDIIRSIRPSLAKHGIALLQPLHSPEAGVAKTTTILAGHGASIQSTFTFRADPNPQEFGRQHTYYRRYQLQAMLGLAGDDDADNAPREKASGQGFSEPEHKSAPKAAPVSADKKPAPAEQKTNGSAKPSVATTKEEPKSEPKPEPKPASAPVHAPAMKDVNALIVKGMKALSWKMKDVFEFYKEHVDPAGFTDADNLTIDQKQMLLVRMAEKHPDKVVPF